MWWIVNASYCSEPEAAACLEKPTLSKDFIWKASFIKQRSWCTCRDSGIFLAMTIQTMSWSQSLKIDSTTEMKQTLPTCYILCAEVEIPLPCWQSASCLLLLMNGDLCEDLVESVMFRLEAGLFCPEIHICLPAVLLLRRSRLICCTRDGKWHVWTPCLNHHGHPFRTSVWNSWNKMWSMTYLGFLEEEDSF